MSAQDILMSAAGATTSPTYIEDVFSTYIYTGNGDTQTINNGIALASSPETVAFSTPAIMNGSATAAYMISVCVNSSGKFVAVGYNSSNYPVFATSTDGSTWTTPALMNGSTTTAYMRSVCVNSSGKFVAVGYNSSNYPVFATSTDGSTWTTPTTMPVGPTVYIQSVCVNSSGKFVAVGYNTTLGYPTFATSTDGSTWSTLQLMNGSTTYAHILSVTVNSSGKFVAVGYNDSYYPVFATSTDGSTWTTPALMNGATNVGLMQSVCVNNLGKFVAVGGLFASSTDGSTWTTPTSFPGGYSSMYGVAVNSSGKFVAVGYDDNTGRPIFATSTDGSTWTTPASMNGTTTAGYINSVAVNSSGKFVAVGSNSSNYPIASLSTDVAAVTGKGGMVWLKSRSAAYNNLVADTVRGVNNSLSTDANWASIDYGSLFVNTPSSTGFSVGSGTAANENVTRFSSWTFAKSPKFFDIVTYTGNGVQGRNIAHSLGVAPGMMIIKSISNDASWLVYHTSVGPTKAMIFNDTAPANLDNTAWNNTAPTASEFTVGSNSNVNASGYTYVAYLFAHDTTTNGLIQCGSFTTDGSGLASINLGWEPQYVLCKTQDITENWFVQDNMRGMSYVGYNRLFPNSTLAEASSTGVSLLKPTSTGFNASNLTASTTFIYMAIRRGPMRTPTDGTKMFNPNTTSATAGTKIATNFPIDLQINARRGTYGINSLFMDRLRGVSTNTSQRAAYVVSSSTGSEVSSTNNYAYYWDNTGYLVPTSMSASSNVTWNFRRAPGFFDIVCYTGNGAVQNVNHNLGVAPEMILMKCRDVPGKNWIVYHAALGNSIGPSLNWNNANWWTGSGTLNSTNPTSSVFTLGSDAESNQSTAAYVAYLFASCPGVSKVGSYTGTGATQTISCGFTGGARFVLIKRTDSQGDWYVWDVARGMVSGTDPKLALNLTTSESNANWVYTITGGFQIVTTDGSVNASGGSYIYLAIA